jgi:ADP-ribosylglycohydrolase
MALALARLLAERGAYNAQEAMAAYVNWLESSPFDCGHTVSMGLAGSPNPESQANGALMRISPLGILGAQKNLAVVARWAEQDASLTHPHPVCLEANALFAMAIAVAIRTGISAPKLYEQVVSWAEKTKSISIREAIDRAAESPPNSYTHQQGWVLIAFQNALWQLLHAPNLEEGIVDTVMRGGDTDTNAAIAGALLGAVYGKQAVPEQWTESILSCRPHFGVPGVRRPRPPQYWPVDTLELAARLVAAGSGDQAGKIDVD